MKLTKTLLASGLVAAAITLGGCGGTAQTPAAPVPGDGGAGAGAGQQLGGNLTVYLPSPAGLADDLIARFEAETGVTVNQFQGTTGQIMARLQAEAANPIADVVILASWSDGMELERQGLLLPFEPAQAGLLHPGFASADHTMYGTSASAVGVAYNTLLFDGVTADWNDFADPQFHDQLAAPDPELSGSAKDFLAGYIHDRGEQAGWQTWEALANNGMIIPGANAAALESVVTGERGVLVGGVDWNVFAAMDRGEPLNFYYPAGGTVVNPRPAMILQTSQNQENAKAFVDFLLSDEAQQMVVDAFLIPGRSDIQSDRRPNMNEIHQLNTDWDWMVDNATSINSRFNGLFR
jgi:iron(III) transport system substrate-binding protein